MKNLIPASKFIVLFIPIFGGFVCTVNDSVSTETAVSSEPVVQPPPIDCSYEDLPANLNWHKVKTFYENCKNYKTTRARVMTISEFLKVLQDSAKPEDALSKEDAKIIKQFYRKLKYCSECETVDCRNCNEILELQKKAKKLAIERRYSY